MPKTKPVITDIPDMNCGWLFDPPHPITRIHLWRLDPLESTILETETNDVAVLAEVERILASDFAERDILPDDTSFLYNPTFIMEIHGYDAVRYGTGKALFVVGNVIMENMSCSTVCCVPKHDHRSSELWDVLEKVVDGKPTVNIPHDYGWIFKFHPITARNKKQIRELLKLEANPA